jgi:hypothetical protein
MLYIKAKIEILDTYKKKFWEELICYLWIIVTLSTVCWIYRWLHLWCVKNLRNEQKKYEEGCLLGRYVL